MDFEDIFMCAVATILAAFLMFLVYCGLEYIYKVHQYNKSPYVEVEATLIENRYCESTLQSHTAPIFNSGKDGGTSMVFYSTGHDENRITIWETKEYGRLMSDNPKVWRLAKPKSILRIKMWLNDPYIDDIKE